MLSRTTLRKLWPRASRELVSGIAASAPRVLAKYDIKSPRVLAQMMAQFSHECGAGLEMVENIRYSAKRAAQVWPRRFSSAADCYRKVDSWRGDPNFHVKLIDHVYGGRMGNRPYPSHDGSTYIGRGLSQTTGLAGYRAVARAAGIDVVNSPDKICDPAVTFECAVADFVRCGCLPYAERGDLRGVTRRLNGGYIGLAERRAWLTRWEAALAAAAPETVAVPMPKPRPPGAVLQYEDEGPEVRAVQQQLAAKGYACGTDDGEFHEATRDAVNAFKADNDLPTDGAVDDATRAALKDAPDRPLAESRERATVADLRARGSRTVAAADKLGFLGKLKVLVGAGGAVGGGLVQSGEVNLDTVSAKVDQAQAAIDKAKHIYSFWDSARDAVLPLLHSPVVLWGGLALAVVGILVLLESRKVSALRLADHQTGANMGR